MESEAAKLTRRTVVASAAGLAAAGCTTYGKPSGQQPPPQQETQPPAPEENSGAAGSGVALAAVADIPVGGGTVFADQQVVVTHPEPGNVRGFSSTCTHQGCTVAEVAGSTINCPCHGSKFNIADGSVANGPAASPLPPVQLRVQRGAIRLA